ncbi:MAG TPA: PadR family transcriptional regulator [Ktedonobacterales bacterium]|nr:PadR family transcriptional regulator [Ktedonobacterales bacterium]
MGRRFPFGGGPGPRMFERGYLKYALLELLKERPKHGYEMMKELEERMGGFYAPSAGAIYPTLQLLEDRGWVTSEPVEGKKVYKITPEGSQALDEVAARRGPQFGPEGPEHGPHGHHEHHEHHGQRERFERGPWGGPWGGPGRGGPGFGWRGQPEARDLARQARELGRTMLIAGMQSMGDPERLTKLRGIVERTRAELDAFMRENGGSSGAGGPAESGSGPIEQF